MESNSSTSTNVPNTYEQSTRSNITTTSKQIIKFKKPVKTPITYLEPQLEKIMGITSKNKNCFILNQSTGDLIYAAGSITVLYNIKGNRQTKYYFAGSKKPVTALAISRDGQYLAVADKGLEISIWELDSDSKKPLHLLKGHKYGIEVVLFSPNMKYLVSIGDASDKGLFVWDWQQEQKLTMNKLSKKVNFAMFNEIGTYLLTAGEQHLKFWNFDSDGNVIYGKSKEPSVKENPVPTSDASISTNVTSATTNPASSVNIIEGKSAQLGKLSDKIFIDAVCSNGFVYTMTQDGIFCVVNEVTRGLEKWIDFKVSAAYSVINSSNWFICACSDGLVRFLNNSTLELAFTLPKPPALGKLNLEKRTKPPNADKQLDKFADCISIAYDDLNGKLMTLYSDRTLFVWDLRNLDKITVYKGFLNHSGSIHDIQVLPTSSSFEITFFATGSADKTVRVWNAMDDENKESEKLVKRNPYCKDLNRIIYMNDNYDHFKCLTSNAVITNEIKCLNCSPTGEDMAAGDQLGNLRIYNMVGFDLKYEFKAHEQEILCLEYSPLDVYNNTPEKICFLATGGRDRLLQVYDVKNEYALIASLDEHSSSIISMKFYYNKQTSKFGLISCGAERSIYFRVWNTELKKFETLHHEVDKVNKFYSLYIHHEQTQAVLGQEKKITIWNIDTGKPKCTYETKEDDQNAKSNLIDNLKVIIDMTGSYIATSNKDGILRIRDFYTGNLIGKINCGDLITGMLFTQNNKNLITTTSSGCILFWKLPEEMVNNMNRKKAQLKIIVKKLKEILEGDITNDNNNNNTHLLKDFKFDTLLVEKELKEYIAKQKQEKNQDENNSNTQDDNHANINITSTVDNQEQNEAYQPKILIDNQLPSWAMTNTLKAEVTNKNPTNVVSGINRRPLSVGKWAQKSNNNNQSDDFSMQYLNISDNTRPNNNIINEQNTSHEKEKDDQVPMLITYVDKGGNESNQGATFGYNNDDMKFNINPTNRIDPQKSKYNSGIDHEQDHTALENNNINKQMSQKAKNGIPFFSIENIDDNDKDAHDDVEDYKDEKFDDFLEEEEEKLNILPENKLDITPATNADNNTSKYKGNLANAKEFLDGYKPLSNPSLRQGITITPATTGNNIGNIGKTTDHKTDYNFSPIPAYKEQDNAMNGRDRSASRGRNKDISVNKDIDISQTKDRDTSQKKKDNIFKYKHDSGDNNLIESVLDINQIKNQISQVSKVVEDIQREKIEKTEKTNNTLRSIKIINDVDNYNPYIATTTTLQDQITYSGDNSAIQNTSNVMFIDKKNLVPTTLEELFKKSQTSSTSNLILKDNQIQQQQQMKYEYHHVDNSVDNIVSFLSNDIKKTPSDDIPTSGMNKMAFVPTKKDPLDYNISYSGGVGSNYMTPLSNQAPSSQFKLGSVNKGLSEISQVDIDDSTQISRPLEQDMIENEIDKSFEIIDEQLRKLGNIMGRVKFGPVKDNTIKNRLIEKIDNRFDITRRSINNLSSRPVTSASVKDDIRTERSFISDTASQKAMNEAILNASRDLLDNYSRMLIESVQKELLKNIKK